MQYLLGLFCALSVTAQTALLTEPAQFRHRMRLIDFEADATGQPFQAFTFVTGAQWRAFGLLISDSDQEHASSLSVGYNPSAPASSVHSGQLGLEYSSSMRGFLLLTFPSRREKRGFTREVGLWTINGSFKRNTVVGPHPTRSVITFFDRHGQLITNVTTEVPQAFVGLRHPRGIGAVRIDHSTGYPIIDDVMVGRVFPTRQRRFWTGDFE